jgi:subtilisin family serine protease
MQNRTFRRASLLMCIAGSGLSIAGLASAQVQFRSAPDKTPVVMTDNAIAESLRALAGRHAVVQFATTPTDQQRAAIEAGGVKLLAPLGDHAYFAKIAEQGAVAMRNAAALSPKSVRAVSTDWKLSPMFSVQATPTWAVVPGGTESDPRIGAYVALHDDQTIDAAAQALVERFGGEVRDVMLSVNGMVIELPLSAVRNLAADDRVMWIEPALPQMSEINAENRILTGANTAQAAPYNLSGAGVTAFIYDGGTARATHQDFQGRLTLLDASTQSNHSTHVAGTVGGAGVVTANNKGMAPAVTLLSAGLQYSGSGTFLYTNPGDIEADYAAAIAQGADVANNSIGTNTESNGFDCAYQGQYGLTDKLIDQIATGSAGGPIIICWAAGNERQGTRCNVEGFGSYYSVAPPSGAKNHIPVGATNANDDSMTSFSSWGPMDDGRLVPVVSGPGCQVGGDGGVTSCGSSSDTAYASLCGTSMATPTVTGLVALLLQDYRVQFPASGDPSGATVKALLAHNAVDRGNAGPDYQFGYGSVRIIPTIDFMRTGAFTTAPVSHGARNRYTITVAPGTSQLKYTLTWADVAATPNAAKTLINDLDLVLISPTNQEYNAWTLDPLNPSAPAVRTSPNRLDNIEQVVVDNPAAGTWKLEVRGYNVPQGPQTYSLVGLPGNSTYSTAGIGITTTPATPMAPGVATPMSVSIQALNDTITPGSETFSYRFSTSDPFTTVPLSLVSPGVYSATLPAGRCGETIQYYASVTTAGFGTISDPVAGSAAPYSRLVDVTQTLVSENFNAVNGWAESSSPQLTSALGKWDRGTPLAGLTRGEPTADFDGSGQCWLTGNVLNGDVDGGPTTLTSPIFNTSGKSNVQVSYARYVSCDDFGTADNDNLIVQISTDGGATWPTTLETASSTGSWVQKSFAVPASAQFRIRFQIGDVPNASVTEAAVDAFKITASNCTYDCPADIDRSGEIDLVDYFAFFNAFDATDPLADIDGIPGVDLGDFFTFLNSFDQGCTP